MRLFFYWALANLFHHCICILFLIQLQQHAARPTSGGNYEVHKGEEESPSFPDVVRCSEKASEFLTAIWARIPLL